MALERRARAEGDDRHAVLGAEPDDLAHFGGRLREDHGIRRLVRDPGQGVAVLPAHCRGWSTTRSPKRGEGGGDRREVAGVRAASAGSAAARSSVRSHQVAKTLANVLPNQTGGLGEGWSNRTIYDRAFAGQEIFASLSRWGH